jgi:hypothetical protein
MRRGADDPRTSVGVGLILEQRFEQQEEFFGKHENTLLKFIRQAKSVACAKFDLSKCVDHPPASVQSGRDAPSKWLAET